MTNSETPIEDKILAGRAVGQTLMNLDGFKDLYKRISIAAQRNKQDIPSVEIFLLAEVTVVKFSSAKRFFIRIKENRPLYEKDFEIIISPKFYGNIRPIPLRAFVWTEIRHNGVVLAIVFVLFLVFLSFDSQNANLQIISQMLVEANALFIGIFVLFTITQNRDLLATRKLVEDGITHQMMQNDIYITSLSIISLLSAFLTVAMLDAPINVTLWTGDLFSQRAEITVARLIGVGSLILLIDCFLAVTKYYLRAMRTAVESKMVTEIMSSQDKTE